MISSKIKFGTDGWRGIIGDDFTFDNVRICAQGVANYLKETTPTEGGIVIGYDTRFASEEFAAAAAEVIAGNKIKVYLCPKPTPTPVISYAVVATKACGAIIITASHNPALWNGFKFKIKDGASAPRPVINQIEKQIAHVIATGNLEKLPLSSATKKGLINYWDPAPAYKKHLESLINLSSLRQSQLKIIVDAMYGTGAGYFPDLLREGKIQITEINKERNPLFPGIQPEPIAKNLVKLSNLVKEQQADVGLANDVDADRIGIINEKGEFLNPQEVFALLTLYFLEVRREKGAIIKTVSSTDMLHRLGELFQVPVYETAVGFPYVAPLMLEKKALIGGEESGGYAFRNHIPERDGILAGLYFLDLMVKTNKSPSQLTDYLYSKVGLHYYDRLDFPLPSEKHQEIIDRIQTTPNYIAGIKVTGVNTTDGFRFLLADGSWLLIRFSGTEPLVRLYAESTTKEKVAEILENGKKILKI